MSITDHLTGLNRRLASKGKLTGAAGMALDRSLSVGPGRALRQFKNEAGLLEKERTRLYRDIWTSAASRIGATWTDFGGGVIDIERSGNTTRVWRDLVPLGDPVTHHVTNDKPLAQRMLAEAGLAVPEARVFQTRDLDEAARYVGSTPNLMVIKPASATGAGAGVTGSVLTETEAWRAMLAAVRFDARRVMVEEQITGRELRLIVLDGEVVAALERRQPAICGDGSSTVMGLIDRENKRRRDNPMRAGYRQIGPDLDTELNLRRQDLGFRSVLDAGTYATVATSSSQGSERDATALELESMDQSIIKSAVRAAGILDSRFLSVEFIIRVDRPEACVLEVNSSPGIAHHYVVDNPDATAPVADRILEHLLS
ncbi:MAG: hypothetical protein OEO77_11075 [Acidimicrobiia bacterium]|nr:hypothetical protein [Acidimicrobiia bacterium]